MRDLAFKVKDGSQLTGSISDPKVHVTTVGVLKFNATATSDLF
jgi:hypothetical protein